MKILILGAAGAADPATQSMADLCARRYTHGEAAGR